MSTDTGPIFFAAALACFNKGFTLLPTAMTNAFIVDRTWFGAL